MKQLTALTLVCLMAFASCQKEPLINNANDINYNEADFVDNEIVSPNANKNPDRKSNLKVVIRQVNNAENTYRLVLKVDSVSADLDRNGIEEMYPLGDNATVQAGLSIPNPADPTEEIVVFNQTSLNFRKQNENGYYVFVSDAFRSDLNFDYELVKVSYLIGHWTFDDAAGQDASGYNKITGSGQYFILPSGKTIEQAPKVTNVKIKGPGPGRGGSGSSAVFNSIRLTTFDDPIGDVGQVVFKAIVIGLNSTKEETRVPLEARLVPVGVGNTLGVTIWATDRCIGYIDPKNNEWKCEDELLRPYTNFAVLLSSCALIDDDGNTIGTTDLLAGSTDHL